MPQRSSHIRLNRKRFEAEIALRTFEHDGWIAISIADLNEIIYNLQCSAGGYEDVERCTNEARYDSGYCSIHDMLINDSKGKRIT